MTHMDRKVSLLKHFPADLIVPLPLLLNALRLCPYADAVADRMTSLRAKSTVPLYMTHLDVLCVLTYVAEDLTPSKVANLAEYLQTFAEGLRRDMRSRLHAVFSGYVVRAFLREVSKGRILRRYERTCAAKTIVSYVLAFRVRRRLGIERCRKGRDTTLALRRFCYDQQQQHRTTLEAPSKVQEDTTLALRRYSARGVLLSPTVRAVSPVVEEKPLLGGNHTFVDRIRGVPPVVEEQPSLHRVTFSPRRAEAPSWTPRPILRTLTPTAPVVTPQPAEHSMMRVVEGAFHQPLRSPRGRRRLDPVEESLRSERELEEERRHRMYNRSKWA